MNPQAPSTFVAVESLAAAGQRLNRAIDSTGFAPWRRYGVKCRLHNSVRRLIKREMER